jgi:hypothetical protein
MRGATALFSGTVQSCPALVGGTRKKIPQSWFF